MDLVRQVLKADRVETFHDAEKKRSPGQKLCAGASRWQSNLAINIRRDRSRARYPHAHPPDRGTKAGLH